VPGGAGDVTSDDPWSPTLPYWSSILAMMKRAYCGRMLAGCWVDNPLGSGGGGNREAIRGRGGQAAVGDGKREGSGVEGPAYYRWPHHDRADILGAQERALPLPGRW